MKKKNGRKPLPVVSPPAEPVPEIDERELVDGRPGAEDRATWNLGNGGRWIRPRLSGEGWEE
jgi:hypothetical protein